jgi:hypothetical protein
MDVQWYLCEIDNYPEHEGNELKKTDNLSVKYPDVFIDDIHAILHGDRVIENNKNGEGSWFIWTPIIPRVGDTLQFGGWQVQVSRVLLETDWMSQSGTKEGVFRAARITIRDDVVPELASAHFSVEALENNAIHKWEDFARRGNDLQYFAWELRHDSYIQKEYASDEVSYYRWHTRIRPITGDIILVENNRWRVKSVELASANASVDGWLYLESA